MGNGYTTTTTTFVEPQPVRRGTYMGQEAYTQNSFQSSKFDYQSNKLKKENAVLSREVHDLKKKEASSIFGRGREGEIGRLTHENGELTAEVNALRAQLNQVHTTQIVNLETNVTNLRQSMAELEAGNVNLINENRQLRAEIDRIRIDSDRRVNHNGQELQSNIQLLKTHLNNEVDNANALNEELARIKADNVRIRGQYDQLASASVPLGEHQEIISRHTNKIRTLESDKQSLERQVNSLNQERSQVRREMETLGENRRKDAQDLDQETGRLRHQLDLEVENRNELLRDLEELRRRYETLKTEHQRAGEVRGCKYHNEDGSLKGENQMVTKLTNQLQEKNREIEELNQTILGLRHELQTMRTRHAEQLASFQANQASFSSNDRQRMGLLEIEKEDLALKNTYLSKEMERLKEQTSRSSSVERQVFPRETTVTTTSYPVTSTSVRRMTDDYTRQVQPVISRFEYVAQPATTIYTTPGVTYPASTITYKAEPVTTYNYQPVVSTTYKTAPVVYETHQSQYPATLVSTNTSIPHTTIVTKTTEMPETITTTNETREVKRSVVRM
jgi:DNA repair exonuclease SbcCD ATPase subunit